MNCYVCHNAGRAISAVAVWPHCGAALCREHLDQDLLEPRPQGQYRQGCSHHLVQSAKARRREASSGRGHLPSTNAPDTRHRPVKIRRG
jgi:hypothetical protein